MVAHRKGLIALSLAILLLAAQCYPQSSPSRNSLQKEGVPYLLAGRVLNSVTEKPIPRVLVRLPDLQRAALSDSEGNFSFSNVPAGKVAILVSKPGYFRADQPLVPDQFYTRNNAPYEFEGGPQRANPVLKLLPEAVIFGTVRGSTGEVRTRTVVSALITEEGKQNGPMRTVGENVVTDDDGKFFISGLAPGRYYLRVRPSQAAMPQPKTAVVEERYPTEVYFPNADATGASPLDLAAGQAREANFNLKLIRVDKTNSSSTVRTEQHEAEPEQTVSRRRGGFRISGVLVDELSGGPISQGEVTISEVSHPFDPLAAVVTGSDGRFFFSELADGKYYIMAAGREGRGYSFYDSHNPPFTTAIVVGPGLDPGELIFRLPVFSRLSGRIADEAGEPVHKAHVVLYWTGTKYGTQTTYQWYQVETNEQGAYHFENLIPGRYFIVVMASPWYAQRPATPQRAQRDFYSFFFNGGNGGQTLGTYLEEQGPSPLDVAYPVTFYPGTTEASVASPIMLRKGEHPIANLTLKPVPALHVFLSTSKTGAEEEAAKLYSAQIKARLFNSSPVDVPAETRILSSGQIDITGLTPGHYQVKVHAVQNNRVNVAELGEMDVSSSGEGILAREQPSVPLTANVLFEGTPGPSSNPANRSLFMSDPDSRKLYSVSVPAAGPVELQEPIEPGNYRFGMNSDISHFIKAISATGATVSGNTVKIDGSAPVNVNVTVAFDGGVVTGVALRDGKPFGGAMILLAPLAAVDPLGNQSLFKEDQSNSDGSFGMDAIAPGKYVLMAIENGWDLEWTNPSALRPYLYRAVTLHIEENGKYNVTVGVQ